MKKLQTKKQNDSNNIYFWSAKKSGDEKSKEDEQTLNSAHRRSQAKCQLVQTSYICYSIAWPTERWTKKLFNEPKLFI